MSGSVPYHPVFEEKMGKQRKAPMTKQYVNDEVHADSILNSISAESIDKDTNSARIALECLLDGIGEPDMSHSADIRRHARIYLLYSLVQKQYSRLDLSIEYALKALRLYDELNDRAGCGETCNYIGVFNMYAGNFTTGIAFLQKAKEIAWKNGDFSLMGRCLYNISHSHILHCNDPERAIAAALESIRSFRRAGKGVEANAFIAKALNVLCDAHFQKKNYAKAMALGKRSIELSIEYGNKQLEGESCLSIGTIYRERNDTKQALQYFLRAFDTCKKHGFLIFCGISMKKIGEVYADEKKGEKALFYLNQAAELFQKGNANGLIYECYESMAKIYEMTDRKQDALRFYGKAVRCKEQVLIDEADITEKTSNVMFSFEQAQKEAEIFRIKNIELKQEIDMRKQTMEQLKNIAHKDSLTNIYNRHQFFKCAKRLMEESAQKKMDFCILFIDFDNFMAVNEKFGHRGGDYVIVSAVHVLLRHLRPEDIIGRYGGEEFVVLLPETTLEDGLFVAEKFRKAVEQAELAYKEKNIAITISIGIASENTSNGATADMILEHADSALLCAKNNGRNRVEPYSRQLE